MVNGCQQVEYENLDMLCMNCGIVGHLQTQCSIHATKLVGQIQVGSGRSSTSPKILSYSHNDGIPLMPLAISVAKMNGMPKDSL